MIVSVDGAELYYSTRGTGPACLVPSSIGTAPYQFQMPAMLSERLRLVFVDLRGGGRSTGNAADLSFDVLASDLEAIRTDLGVERVAVLGHSILGMLALEYGRRCPASVSHVIAVGTPPTGDMAVLSARAAAFFEEDASQERKGTLASNLAKLTRDADPTQSMLAQTPLRFFDPHLDVAPLFAEAEVKPALLGHLMGKLAPSWDVSIGASSLRVPILIAHGRYDYTVPYRMWDGLVERLPRATLHIFERSGHQPFYEEPDRFSEVLMAWMARER